MSAKLFNPTRRWRTPAVDVYDRSCVTVQIAAPTMSGVTTMAQIIRDALRVYKVHVEFDDMPDNTPERTEEQRHAILPGRRVIIEQVRLVSTKTALSKQAQK